MKTCTLCGQPLPASAFSRDRSRKDGRAHRCRDCDSVKASSWQQENPEHRRATKRNWYANNVEVQRARRQFWAGNQKRRTQGIPVQKLTGPERAAAVNRRLECVTQPCFYCGLDGQMEVDHLMPVSMGGTDHAWNLVPACPGCNRRKFTHCGTWAVLRLAA